MCVCGFKFIEIKPTFIAGFFRIVKVPRLNSLTCAVTLTDDLAFKLKRKQLSISVCILSSAIMTYNEQEYHYSYRAVDELPAEAAPPAGSLGHGESHTGGGPRHKVHALPAEPHQEGSTGVLAQIVTI